MHWGGKWLQSLIFFFSVKPKTEEYLIRVFTYWHSKAAHFSDHNNVRTSKIVMPVSGKNSM